MKTEAKAILEKVKNGDISVDEALLVLKNEPFRDLGFAKIDTHRKIRQGETEVIYGDGKTPSQIIQICEQLNQDSQSNILITRLSIEAAAEVSKEISLKYYDKSRIGVVGEFKKPDGIGNIVIATGGTSDMDVAEEAAVTAEFFGNKVIRLYDVGVSGIHRLFSYSDEIMSASVIIAIAGMEGALASVIGGISDCPVIAVPTSVGYGASFDGLAALLSMLNSCASGVLTVNIDNGFGAGYAASMINHMEAK